MLKNKNKKDEIDETLKRKKKTFFNFFILLLFV